MVVIPLATYRKRMSSTSSRGGSAPGGTCACISASPGIRNRPVPSITVAPRGASISSADPTAVIMPSPTTTVRPDSTVSEVMGRMDTPVNTVGPGLF